MMINLKDNSEKDKYILELFQTSPKEAFRLLFDAYHMKLCIYAVQLTDSFEMAEDIVQDFFIYFWEKKYYLKINQNLRYYLYLSVRNAAINALQKNNMLSMEELSGIDMGIPEESIDEEEQEERNKLLLENYKITSSGITSGESCHYRKIRNIKKLLRNFIISVNTLKTHLTRALKQLRKEYNLHSLVLTKIKFFFFFCHPFINLDSLLLKESNQ